jgi:hypothetical protein
VTKLLAILRPASIAYGAAAVVAYLEALVLGFEMLGVTLTLSLLPLASILAFAISAELAPTRIKLPHFLFFIPVGLVLAGCLSAQLAQGAYINVPALYRWIFLLYILQLIPAYLVLLTTSGKHS